MPKTLSPEHIQEALEIAAEQQAAPCAPQGKPAGPCVLVIFGASGDLTKRKLVPALYNLACGGLLPTHFAVVGVARAALDTAAFRTKFASEIRDYATREVDPALAKHIEERLYYVSGSFEDPETYRKLAATLTEIDRTQRTEGNYLYYLATAPEAFSSVVRELGQAKLAKEEDGRWRRVIVEKPFGKDLESAQALNGEISAVLDERQIYRIDHYLGKETVQNILVFRFGNGMFEPIWNRRYIDHVQITVSESLGVEGRGGYYDTAGALRDMVPNHILQLLALTAMEPPTSLTGETVREEKAKVLRAIAPMTPEKVLTHAVRGQYGEGQIGSEHLPAYRREERVNPRSAIETYAALKLNVDNWRWADVPFYLRTGKRLAQRSSEIAIHFRRAPLLLFRDTPIEQLSRNMLVMRIQPEEGISMRFGAKVPGPVLRMGNVAMDFHYADHFGATVSTGYETLLYDCMNGDQTLFQRADMVEVGWSIVNPVLEVWKALPPREFPNYAAGSWGPKDADELLARDGRKWNQSMA